MVFGRFRSKRSGSAAFRRLQGLDDLPLHAAGLSGAGAALRELPEPPGQRQGAGGDFDAPGALHGLPLHAAAAESPHYGGGHWERCRRGDADAQRGAGGHTGRHPGGGLSALLAQLGARGGPGLEDVGGGGGRLPECGDEQPGRGAKGVETSCTWALELVEP